MNSRIEVCWLSCRADRRYKDQIEVCREESAVRCCLALNISPRRRTFAGVISLGTVDQLLTFAASLIEEAASTSR